MKVYLLWHSHELEDDFDIHDEVKLIGVFSSENKANEVIENMKNLEGFKDYPLECFHVEETEVDKSSWTDGFVIARWSE